MGHVVEPEKRVPVAHDVDVAVAGAGVSGLFAALTAARSGARTAIIDRFAELGGTSLQPYSNTLSDYAHSSHLSMLVGHNMLEDSGVKVLMSTQVADPIMEGNRVRGLFVENKSGRSAVRAKVVIDATGEADTARRAGAPILYPKTEYHDIDAHAPTGMGLYFLITGINWDRYHAVTPPEVTEEDTAWGVETLGERHAAHFRAQLPYMRRANERGDLDLRYTQIELDGATLNITIPGFSESGTKSSFHGRIQVDRIGELDASNGDHISRLEIALRMHVVEMARFWKSYLPGFEDSSVANLAPFLGSRGGPCIDGEYTLTMDDCMAAKRFDDVTYLYGQWIALKASCERGKPEWADVPYRVMVPKEIDGLLATGRSASCIPDTLLRNRMAAMILGQTTGIAAALAVDTDVVPRELDIRRLQTALLDAGGYVGDRHRIRELGLV
jgi:hypothetical protein